MNNCNGDIVVIRVSLSKTFSVLHYRNQPQSFILFLITLEIRIMRVINLDCLSWAFDWSLKISLVYFWFVGKLYLDLKRYSEAEDVYHQLLLRNPENTTYYMKLQEAQQLQCTDDILHLFTTYQEYFPRAQAPRRLPLNYASGMYLF